MKTILKTVLFILLGCIITVTSLAQQRTSPDSLIIGKWKLRSCWVKRSGKAEYMPMNKIGMFVYEFKNDGTYVNYAINSALADTSFFYGHWKLTSKGKRLHLFNASYKSFDSSSKGKLFPIGLNIEMNIISLSSKELRLNGDAHYEEADSASLYLYTSLYTRINWDKKKILN